MAKLIQSKLWWLLLLMLVIGVNLLATVFHFRFDLTKEKRYTLSNATRQLLRNLDDEVSVEVFLEGDFPAGFKKLAMGIQEFLQECKEYGKGNLNIIYTDPLKNLNDSTAERFMDSIEYFYNIPRYILQAPAKVGDEMTQKIVLPGAVIHYQDTAIGVNFLKGNKTYGTATEELAALYNDVESTMEYKFGSAIQKITTTQKPLIGYALGHGEGWGYNVDDAVRTLFTGYLFDTININSAPFIPSMFNALIILKPTVPFSDQNKLKIDQYVMRGGKSILDD